MKKDTIASGTIAHTVMNVSVGVAPHSEYIVAGSMVKGRQIAAVGGDWREICRKADLETEASLLNHILGPTDVHNCYILNEILCESTQAYDILALSALVRQLPQICADVFEILPEIILYYPIAFDNKADSIRILLLQNGYRCIPGTDYLYYQHGQ